MTDEGEQCDDGNTLSGDGCSSTCNNESICGNGEIEEGEECDGGEYCVACKDMSETIKILTDRNIDFHEQKDDKTIGKTDFEYPRQLPVTGPDEAMIQARLAKKGIEILDLSHIDVSTTDWIEPVDMLDPSAYDVDQRIKKLPTWARSADTIVIVPTAGIVSPINTVTDSDLLEKFAEGEVELSDYAQQLTDGVLHYPHSANINEVGNAMLR